jgi:hypothetical protein
MCLDGNMPKSGRIDVGDLEANLPSVMMVGPAWRAAASNRRAEFARRETPMERAFLAGSAFFLNGRYPAKPLNRKVNSRYAGFSTRIVYPIEFAERPMEWALFGLGRLQPRITYPIEFTIEFRYSALTPAPDCAYAHARDQCAPAFPG